MSDQSFYLLLIIPLIFFALMYIYAPLKVRQNQKVPIQSATTELNLQENPLMPDAHEHIRRSTAALIERGFTFYAVLQNKRAATGNFSVNALLGDDATGRLAQVAFIFSLRQTNDAPVVTRSTGIILETYYADGFVLQTSTFAKSGIYVSRPNTFGVSFKDFFSDAGELLRQHESLETHLGHGPTRPSGASANPVGFMDGIRNQVMALQAQHGLYVRNDAAGMYEPTYLGAYKMTWKLLPPWKQWTRAAARREARRWMAKAAAPAVGAGR